MPREIVTRGQCRCRTGVGRISSRSRLRKGSGKGSRCPLGCSFCRTRLATDAGTAGALSSSRATRWGTAVSTRPHRRAFRSIYQGSPGAEDRGVVAPVLELARDVLLALAVEAPAEAARARLAEGERAALRVAPMAPSRLERPPQRVAVADRAQPLGLRVRPAEQPADHLVLDADEARRVLRHQVRHRQRVLAPVKPAAQPPGAEGAHRQRLDRGRVPPQPLRRLEEVEHAIFAVAGVPVRRRARGLVDGRDPRLQLGVDRGPDLVRLGRRRVVERCQQRGRRVLALGIDQAGAGAGQPDAAAAAVHDVDARQEWRAPLAADAAGDRATVALDVDVHDGALVAGDSARCQVLGGNRRSRSVRVKASIGLSGASVLLVGIKDGKAGHGCTTNNRPLGVAYGVL